MAAANREWVEALVAEAAAVSREAVAAADQAVAPESVAVMVGEGATAAEAAPAGAVDPVAVTALEGELVVVLWVLRHSTLQTCTFRSGSKNRHRGNQWLAAELALRVLPTRASERKVQFLRSFPLLKSSGDAPAASAARCSASEWHIRRTSTGSADPIAVADYSVMLRHCANGLTLSKPIADCT